MTLPSWLLVPQADGVALVPPGGLRAGVVRIRELQRPLRAVAEILASANTPPLEAGPIEPSTTSEGEYAVFQVQRGVLDGQRVVRYVGAVLGDDAYTLVVALTSQEEALVEHVARECVARCSLGLGHARQRRFRYTPPPRWTERAWDLATSWRAPDGALLIVHPAQPRASAVQIAEAIRRRHTVGALVETAAPAAPCLARAWCTDDLAIVILDDGRFRYPLELWSDSPAAREVLARVAASVRLVPPMETVPITDALLCWAED